MALLWPGSREPERLLDEHDLIRAHIAAPHVLATWQARDAAHWQRAALSLSIGAAIPLFGCFVLQWPIATVIVALALDVIAVGACDVLKGLLAPQRARQEQAHLEEAADVREVMTALVRPRRPSSLQRDLLSAPAHVGYYYAPPAHSQAMPVALIGLILFLIGGLLSLGIIAAVHFLPGAWPWLLFGLVLRFAGSILSTLRARRSPDPAPVLLAESLAPMLAFAATMLVCLVLMKTGGSAITSLPPAWIGGGILAIYFGCTLAVSQWSLGNVREFSIGLRNFIAQDREQLRARVRRVNGDA